METNIKEPYVNLEMKALVVSSLVIGMIVLMGVSMVSSKARPKNQSKKQVTTRVTIGNNELYLPIQIPSAQVLIKLVHLENPGFVVIQENNNGDPGKTLGASSLLTVWESQNITIPLSRETKNEETLFATIRFDNGDGTFDITHDPPPLTDQKELAVPVVVNSEVPKPQ